MHRQILEACLPFIVALIAAFGLLHLTIRLSRASWNWRRIKDLHRCEAGGVQSLSLVLTLPFFVSLISLIVQVSQIIIGMIGVHYAAYAGARAAVVWLPSEVVPPNSGYVYSLGESPNVVDGQPRNNSMPQLGQYQVFDANSLQASAKYRKVWSASVLALTPFGPSRDRGLTSGTVLPAMQNVPPVAGLLLQNLVPGYNATKAAGRINRKLSYVEQNTRVFLEWTPIASNRGLLPAVSPTYNPWGHPTVEYDPRQVGWQDPVTVHVYYRCPMLPGPGRVLAQLINFQYPDRSRHFGFGGGGGTGGFFSRASTKQDPGALVIHASATMNNQGLIPLYGEQLDEY